MVRNIAVLTSGGDSSGMNAALRAVVRATLAKGGRAFVVWEGYYGLINDSAEKRLIREADWGSVSGILNKGGTQIGSARSADFRTREGRRKAAYNLIKHEINYLVVIGGDGSLTGANLLRTEWEGLLADLVAEGKCAAEVATSHKHLGVAGLVGSIDNDMCGTDLTIGADTALHRILEAIDAILSTAMSHQRSFIVEVMGRNCGWLALVAGLCTGADWVLIPEKPPKQGWEEKIVADLERGRLNGRRCSLVIIAEGAIDSEGQPISSSYVKKILEERAGHDTRITILGHVQRGGTPSALDRIIATQMGVAAVEALYDIDFSKEGPVMIGMKGNRMVRLPLMKCVADTHAVAEAIAAKDFKRAIALRGPEFSESLSILKTMYKMKPFLSVPSSPLPSLGSGIRIGIMHSGGPSPGMNSAVRAVVRLGLDHGYSMYGIKNGFQGLVVEGGDIVEMNWMSVNGWAVLGGAELETTRTIPNDNNIQAIVKNIELRRLDVLIMFGGFNGYEGALSLEKYKNTYPSLRRIPVLCVPGTIANNLPGTEWSIGADTALNNVLDAIDKIKQSAVSSRRVFVVEVMGADCGYLATMTGLATGAERAYINETGLTLKHISADLKMMSDRFAMGNRLGLIVTSEKANPTYSTHFVASLIKEESHGAFDVRESILGHLQQGGSPSAWDRHNAARLMYHAIKLIDQGVKKRIAAAAAATQPFTIPHEGLIPAGALGFVDGQIVFTPMDKLKALIHPKYRRPLHQWWFDLVPLTKMIAIANSPSSSSSSSSRSEEEQDRGAVPHIIPSLSPSTMGLEQSGAWKKQQPASPQ